MKRIYKYPLQILGTQKQQIPQCALFRHVGLDPRGQLCVWYEVDTDTPMCVKTFYIVGTGHPVTGHKKYLGSVMMSPFVWHVFVETEGDEA